MSTHDIDLSDFILIVTDKTPPSVWPVMDDPRYAVCADCWEIRSECECVFSAASLKARFLTMGVRSVYVADMYDILEQEGVDREQYITALDELRRGFAGEDVGVRFDGRRYITRLEAS